MVADHGVVDMVVNNAGVSVSENIENLSYDDMEWIVNINFWGVVHGTKAFLPYLQQRPEAALVNVSSIFGIVALPAQGIYNATKFAVRGFTECLRQEMEGTNLFVTTVHPGGIRTNIVRNGRNRASITGDRLPQETMAKIFERTALTTPAKAADVILTGVRKGNRRILIGADARGMDRLQRRFPVRYGAIIRWIIMKLV